MRRSRIKAMATVPARRKPTRDAKNETTDDTPKAYPMEVNDERADVDTPPVSKCLEQTAIEIPKLNPEQNIDLESERSKSDPQTVDTSVTVANSIEAFAKKPESVETIIEENTDSQMQSVLDNSEASGSVDPKTASTNIDSPTVAKTSQTRTSFMRPTPRLDGFGRVRRNSIQGSGASASESEDDNKRVATGNSNRVRNDSVSSMHSLKGRSQSNSTGVNINSSEPTIDGSIANCVNGTKNSLPLTARPKRKMIVSESVRKLAEARREFLLKHEHKQPDKSKLIMYDLIYYNPVTNPMKKSDGSLVSSAQKPSSSVITPETEDDEEKEDEPEEAMPVPQVKVGPDGSLVIDEQSLVIEHTGAKKNRIAMARTKALVDEDGNGSGFYKKRRRSKDWLKCDTLKFYRALNTVGTDFFLIQTVFPQRSRREIKLKFKKEEKINPRLIEKALCFHQEFDIESLKKDLATFDETFEKESECKKKEKQRDAQPRGRKRKKKKPRRMAAASINELSESSSPERTNCEDSDETMREGTSSGEKKNGQRRTVPNDTASRSESTTSSSETGSDTEIYQIKPTRSGRIPKVRKLQAPTINTLDNTFSENEDNVEQLTTSVTSTLDKDRKNVTLDQEDNEKMTFQGIVCSEDKNSSWKSDNLDNCLSGISQVTPGSLVIVSRESTDEPGEKVLQVYMVSSDNDDEQGKGLKKNIKPVVLTPELLNTVTAGITKLTPIHVESE